MLIALAQGDVAFAQSFTPNMANLPLPAVLGGWPTPQKIEGVPEFRQHTLTLEDVPTPPARANRCSMART